MKFKNVHYFKSLPIFFFALALLLVTESCNNSSDSKLIIKGKISGCSDKTIVLESLMPNRVDTLLIEKTNSDGEFELLLDSVPGGFLRLVLDNNNVIYLYGKENQEIYVTGKYPGLVKSYSVSGSDDSELLKKMNLRLIESSDKLNLLKDEITSIANIPDYNVDSLWKITNETALQLYESDKEYLKSFIVENAKSPVIYMALYQYIGTSPILMVQNDLEIFEFVLGQLKENNPDFPHINLLESAINAQRLRDQQVNRDYVDLSPGSEAPDFVLQNTEGKKVSLSGYLGKNVIVAFWASWDKISVTNLKFLAEINTKYDIEIILISLDTGREKWEGTIKGNQIGSFENLCDFKSWDSPVVKIYGVKKLPSYVLVNEESVIEILTDDIYSLQDKIALEF